MNYHKPCQLGKILSYISDFRCKVVIDCTAGEGGHTIPISKLVGKSGKVISIEADPFYYEILKNNVQSYPNIFPVNDSYTNLETIVHNFGLEKVDSVLFDFGMSSFHLEASLRGFSFKKDEVLDLRFNPLEGEPLYQRIKKMDQQQIEHLLRVFGEVRGARKLASLIYKNRNSIRTTVDLNRIVALSIPPFLLNEQLPLVYQAFRIFINDEFHNIISGISAAIKCLDKGGILLTLSYHSVEDRICKTIKMIKGIRPLTKKRLIVEEIEVAENPRCRSSKLRVFKKGELDEESIVDWYRYNTSFWSAAVSGR
jgi:16S rRNA (cytosine1402-N4)-methyltransferase